MNKQTGTRLFLVTLLSILFFAWSGERRAGAEHAAGETQVDGKMTMADRIYFHDHVRGKAAAAAGRELGGSGSAMVARIRFHDRLWEQQWGREAAGNNAEGNATATMLDRIRFHDQLWARSAGTGEMNHADRIRFHDRLWESKR